MRVAAVSASLVLWASSASAGPGVIVAPRVEAFDEPSDSARVVAELGRGAAVLVLDEENQAGVVHRRAGWRAIRLPGSGGVGYVRVEAVDLATASPGEPTEPATTSPGEPTEPATASPDEPTEPATASPDEPTEPAAAPATAPPTPDPPTEHPSRPLRAQAPGPLVAGGFLPLEPARFVLGLSAGVAALREESAAKNRIGSSGATLNGSLGLVIYDVFAISTAAGFILTPDDGSFSEKVVPEQGGDVTTADSSLTVGRYSFAVGLRTPFWALSSTDKSWFAVALYADYGWAGISGSRSISDCIDCRSDDLDFPGGSFWRVGFDLGAPSRPDGAGYAFTAAYQSYRAGAGLTHEVQLGLSIWRP